MFLVLNIIKKAYISGWSSQCASIVLNVHLRTLTVSMATGVSSQWLHLYLHTSLQFGRRKTVCDKRSMSEFTVKKEGKKYPDHVLPMWFWSVHTMDALLSHEAMGEDLWIAVTPRNWCWYIRLHDTTHIPTIKNILFCCPEYLLEFRMHPLTSIHDWDLPFYLEGGMYSTSTISMWCPRADIWGKRNSGSCDYITYYIHIHTHTHTCIHTHTHIYIHIHIHKPKIQLSLSNYYNTLKLFLWIFMRWYNILWSYL